MQTDPALQQAHDLFGRGAYSDALSVLAERASELDAAGVADDDRRRVQGDLLRIPVLRYLGRPDDAMALGASTVAACRTAPHPDLLPSALVQHAHNRLDAGRLADGHQLLTDALTGLVAHGDREGAAEAHRHLGRLCSGLGDLSAAREHFDAAIALADSTLERARVLLDRGRSEHRWGSRDAAHAAWQGAVRAFELAGETSGTAFALLELAASAGEAGEGDADDWLLKAVRAVERSEYAALPGHLARVRGGFAARSGDLDAAEAWFRAALDSPGALANTLAVSAGLAAVLILQGRPTEAMPWLRRVLGEVGTTSLPFAGQVRSMCLGPDAIAGDWTAWDEDYRAALVGRGRLRHVQKTMARAIGASARVCRAVLDEHPTVDVASRATRAGELAWEAFTLAGLHREAEDEAEELRGIVERGAPIPIGAFELHRPIGQGGAGQVWRGRHPDQDLPVAIKVLRHAGGRSWLREVRAVAALDHPRINTILDVGRVSEVASAMSGESLPAGASWIAMRLAQGSLDAWCGRLPWERCREVLHALLEGLAHAHSRGLVHLDIKPANVLVDDPDRPGAGVRITDFGISSRLDDATAWRSAGTPGFMAPEQKRGAWREIGPWSDLFALGVLARALVQGQAVPDRFDAWARTLSAEAPGQRYRSAPEALADLFDLGDAATETIAAIGPPVAAETFDLDAPASTTAPVPGPGRARGRTTTVTPEWRRTSDGGNRALAGAGQGLLAFRTVPIVGRGQEQSRLWTALREAVASQRPRAIVIRGPRGSGKGRLATWLGERAEELGVARRASCTHDPMRPGAPIRDLLAGVFRTRGIPDDELAAVVERAVRLRDPEAPDWCWEAPAAVLSAAAHPTTDALARAIAALARVEPAVVALRDAHWGATSLDVVRRVLVGQRLPVVFVITVTDEDLADRPEETARLAAVQGIPDAIEVRLGPLPFEAVRELVAALLPLDPPLVRRIAERSGGNPSFARQLVEAHAAAGSLEPGPDGLRLRSGAPEISPAAPRDLWSDRLDRLIDAEAERVLAVAATLGRRFDPQVWAHACRSFGVPLSSELHRDLLERALIRELDGGLGFAHEALRETVLARAAPRSTALHLACADALSGVSDHDRDLRRGLHLEAAGRYAEAVALLAREALLAADRGDTGSAALPAVDRCLTLLGVGERDPRRAEPLVWRARLAEYHSDLDRAEALAHRALALEPASDVRGRALRILGRSSRRRGRWAQARERLRAAIDLLEGEGSKRAFALLDLGDLELDQGEIDAAEACYLRAEAVFAEAGEPHEAKAWSALANVANVRGAPDEARALNLRALARYEALGWRFSAASAHNELGEIARYNGDFAAAATHYETATRRFGGSASAEISRINLAIVLLLAGRGDEAAAHLGVVERNAYEVGNLAIWASAVVLGLELVVAADASTWTGRLRAAERALERSRLAHPEIRAALERAAAVAAEAGHDDRRDHLLFLAAEQPSAPDHGSSSG